MEETEDKPIVLNTEIVSSILAGRKTRTRRVLNKTLDIEDVVVNGRIMTSFVCDHEGTRDEKDLTEKYSQHRVGDILYVRETFAVWGERFLYKAGGETSKRFMDMVGIRWKPPTDMPKEFARIFLIVANVRVERLQDISFDDCILEGAKYDKRFKTIDNDCEVDTEMYKSSFVDIWNSRAKDGDRWENNPYVSVYEFERIYA